MQCSQTKIWKKLCNSAKQRYGKKYARQPNKDIEKLCNSVKQRCGKSYAMHPNKDTEKSYAMQPNKNMGGFIALSCIWNEGDKKQKLFVQKHLLYFEDGQFGT